jgi:hypothetical protein
MASAHDADIYKEGAGIAANEFLLCLQEAGDGPKDTAIRRVVVLKDCEKLALQLHELSASVNVMNGKPSLKRKMYVIVHFAVSVTKIQLVPADGLYV